MMEVDTSIQPDLQDPLSATTTNDENTTPVQQQLPRNAPAEIPAGAKWTKTIHPKGRQARDPLAQQVRLTAHSADEMETMLRDYLASPTGPPEHTTVEFTFPTSSAFMVYTGDYSGGSQPKANLYGTLNRSALSVESALSACAADLKDGLKKQKSIAKTLVEHVARADGFRYSFHNNWLSKEDEAHRFSYFCNDSTLNKGRAANEGKGMDNKRKMKPVYDCHGTIHVKFSCTKHSMELHYKHIPIHATYEERAPQPRRNSKRRKIMEVFEPDKLVRERKKKAKAEKPSKSLRRRATEPLPGTADSLDGTDTLAPLLDFLGSAGQEAENADESSMTLNGDGGPPAGLPYPADKLEQLKKATKRKYSSPRQGVVRPPNLQVPGMMSGFMSGDLITWGPREKKKGGKDQTPVSAVSAPASEPLAGIAQAAAEVTAAETATAGLSEIELLKAKLAEAEQRINRLESEKNTPNQNGIGNAQGQSHGGPPGWPPPPAPPHYAYPPPPGFGVQSGGPFQHGQQYHYPPPPQTQGQQHGQHVSPVSAGGASSAGAGGELKTVHWDPKKGRGVRGRPSKESTAANGGVAGGQEQRTANGPPPRGGQVLRL